MTSIPLAVTNHSLKVVRRNNAGAGEVGELFIHKKVLMTPGNQTRIHKVAIARFLISFMLSSLALPRSRRITPVVCMCSDTSDLSETPPDSPEVHRDMETMSLIESWCFPEMNTLEKGEFLRKKDLAEGSCGEIIAGKRINGEIIALNLSYSMQISAVISDIVLCELYLIVLFSLKVSANWGYSRVT